MPQSYGVDRHGFPFDESSAVNKKKNKSKTQTPDNTIKNKASLDITPAVTPAGSDDSPLHQVQVRKKNSPSGSPTRSSAVTAKHQNVSVANDILAGNVIGPEDVPPPSQVGWTPSSLSRMTSTSSVSSKSRLLDLVKQQVDLVKNLTASHTAEMERMRNEKLRMEEDYQRALQEQESTQVTQEGFDMSFDGPLTAVYEDHNGYRSDNVDVGPPAPSPHGNISKSRTSAPLPAAAAAPGYHPHHLYGPGGSDMMSVPPPAPVVEVYEDYGPKALFSHDQVQGPPPYHQQTQMPGPPVPPHQQHMGGHPNQGNPFPQGTEFDEWSTHVYPSTREMAPVATAVSVGDLETPPPPPNTTTAARPVDAFINEYDQQGNRAKKTIQGDSPSPSEGKRRGGPGKNGNANYAPPLEDLQGNTQLGSSSRCWGSFAWFCTFLIPDMCICKKGRSAKMAWREKVAICICALLVSALFVGGFGLVPMLLCTEADMYTFQDIWNQHNEAWTVIHGTIYDMKEYVDIHPGGRKGIVEFLGNDASRMFPRPPPTDLPARCLNFEKDLEPFSTTACSDFSKVDKLVGLPCHDFAAGDGVKKYLGEYRKGDLAYPRGDVQNPNSKMDYIVLYDRVYNVTSYIDAITNNRTKKLDDDSDFAYLDSNLHGVIVNKLNEDATKVYEGVYGNGYKAPIDCLEELFYAGVIDTRFDPFCYGLNILMYSMLVFVALILVLQCLCSLIYLARKSRTFTIEDMQAPVVVMIPCYNEGDKELRKTIHSVLRTTYPDDNKVMLIVADGTITGRGESKSTPAILADILGFEITGTEQSYKYRCIGADGMNMANIFSGTYHRDGRSLKYVVVVKCGMPEERGNPRAGNRGKRDSQLLIMGLFNRIHHGRKPYELDEAICQAFDDLNMPGDELRYMMAIDADTRVDTGSMQNMVFSMNKNEKVLALCGETRVDNKAQSWVTMMQVFEYYTNHHMKKAFESVFGCVTCLPGCFTMYRLFSDDGRPLLSNDHVFRTYSRNDIHSLHEKNLYHLGEDRMLTTLLLQYFPDMSLSFVPEAVCWTIVPHTFQILLSQRRRWINSTFHNMLELLKVKTMCGVCCISMKTVVFLDLIATMTLPASMIYAGYFIYFVVVLNEPISQFMVILYGIIFGVQLIVFVLRSRWDYFFWFLMFVIFGVPVFYFILPIYSFWHMDDFSWGQTRRVDNKKGADNAAPKPKEMERQMVEMHMDTIPSSTNALVPVSNNKMQHGKNQKKQQNQRSTTSSEPSKKSKNSNKSKSKKKGDEQRQLLQSSSSSPSTQPKKGSSHGGGTKKKKSSNSSQGNNSKKVSAQDSHGSSTTAVRRGAGPSSPQTPSSSSHGKKKQTKSNNGRSKSPGKKSGNRKKKDASVPLVSQQQHAVNSSGASDYMGEC